MSEKKNLQDVKNVQCLDAMGCLTSFNAELDTERRLTITMQDTSYIDFGLLDSQ